MELTTVGINGLEELHSFLKPKVTEYQKWEVISKVIGRSLTERPDDMSYLIQYNEDGGVYNILCIVDEDRLLVTFKLKGD